MLTTENTTGYRSSFAIAALAEGQRVKVSGTGVDVAGATDISIGVSTTAVAVGGVATIKLWSAPGTFLVRSNAAIAAGARLFPTANGNVDDAGTTAIGLVAMEAATAANEVFEAARAEVGA